MLKKLISKLTVGDYSVIATSVLFLVYKLFNLSFRFGDGSAYFYMAQSISHGIFPYRDFFLADPPVFLYLLTLLKLFFGEHWLWFQAVPIGLEVINGFLIYLLLRRKLGLAWLAVPVYLFSFTILSTSDFSTGVQLTVMLSLLAWWLLEKEKPICAGIAWAASILTKLYALPAFLGSLGYIIWKKQKWLVLVLTTLIAGIIILLPFFLASPQGFVQSIIIHQFNRTAGNDRVNVWMFFIKHEWVLIILGILGASLKKNRKYLPAFVLSVVFFILFKDLYYLYLAYFFSFLVIFSISLLDLWRQDSEVKPMAWIAGFLLIWSMVGGWYSYQNSVLVQGRFLNAPEIGSFLRTQTAHSEIYGSHEVAPLLALFSDKKLFGNYIDTNSQVFAAGSLDLTKISQAAVDKGIYLVARITDLPDYKILDLGYEGFFSKEIFTKSCSRLKFFPSTSQEQDNYIGIYDCHN